MGVMERKKADNKAIFSLNISFPIIYVRYMHPTLSTSPNILPMIKGLRFIFQTIPNIMDHIRGLEGSHNPALVAEKIYFPIPI